MFRVVQKNGSNVKVHDCSTEEVAKEVKSNLGSRYSGTFSIVDTLSNYCVWDPGGMKILDQEEFRFNLKNCTIVCDAQHFTYFVDHIQKYKPRGTETKYVKIHGYWGCICITIEEFEDLKNQLSNPELAIKAEESLFNKEDKLNALADAGHIARVVKDDDGNIYYSKPADKKRLN